MLTCIHRTSESRPNGPIIALHRRVPRGAAPAALLLAVVASTPAQAANGWALVERFNGDPASPSQALLPKNFDYVATHRMQPGNDFLTNLAPYPADHDENCAGPDPAVTPLRQHQVYTTQTSNGANPDPSFFICKNHMMSSMGDISPYSVTAFWPKQEFDFSDGGTLQFDVNVNVDPDVSDGQSPRHWWEVMIVPRDQLKVGAGPEDSAVDERYPSDRIVLSFEAGVREIKVGTGELDPAGWLVKQHQRTQYDAAYWKDLHPADPALADRRIRRTMRINLRDDAIFWRIRTAEGQWDTFKVNVPGGLPFDKGLVLFKTHSYTPGKDGNTDTFTYHWDNIRFDGPVVGRYEARYADDVVYLQRNGDRPIGDSQMVSIDLPAIGEAPVLFGQINAPKRGQVLVSINGAPPASVDPYEYDKGNGCYSSDWKSFRLPLDPAALLPGINTFQWSVGPRPACNFEDYQFDGFSVKFLQVQTDR